MFEATITVTSKEDLDNFLLGAIDLPNSRVEVNGDNLHLIAPVIDKSLLHALLNCGTVEQYLFDCRNDSAGQVESGEPSKVSDSLPESEERSKVIDNLPESEELIKASDDSLSESEDQNKPDKNPEDALSKVLHGQTIDEVVENFLGSENETGLKERFIKAIKSFENYFGRTPTWEDLMGKGLTNGDRQKFGRICKKYGLKANYVKKIIFTYCMKYCTAPKMEHLYEIKENSDLTLIEEFESDLKSVNPDNGPIGPQVLAIFQKYFRIGFIPEEAEKMIDALSESIDPSSYSEESRLFWANVASNLREIYGFSEDESKTTSFEFLETIKRFVSN